MPIAYTTTETREGDHIVCELRDGARDQVARIAPAIGATCFEYRVAHLGETVHLLEQPPDLAAVANRPTGYGVPILFPFPNRIREGKWTFRGGEYRFADANAGGNHIHGLVYNRKWQVEMRRATEDGATCALSFDSMDFDDILPQYPFPFQLLASYELRDGGLTLTFSATNTGEQPMPMGVGLHPYFSAPISPNTDPADCLITVPAAAYWELENFLPTGEVLPVSGDNDLRDGKPFAGMRFDDVFTQIVYDEAKGVSRCVIEDRGIGVRTLVESDDQFRELVVYTPPNRRSICFEPYTCPTDAVNLEAGGIEAGVIVLEPEETFTGSMRVAAEPV